MYVNNVKLLFKSNEVCEDIKTEVKSWHKGYVTFKYIRAIMILIGIVATVFAGNRFYLDAVKLYSPISMTVSQFFGDVIAVTVLSGVLFAFVDTLLIYLIYQLTCESFCNKYIRTTDFKASTIKRLYKYYVNYHDKLNDDMFLSGIPDIQSIVPNWSFIMCYKSRVSTTTSVYVSKLEDEVNGWVLKVIDKEKGKVETQHRVSMLADEGTPADNLLLVVSADSMIVYDKTKEVANVH